MRIRGKSFNKGFSLIELILVLGIVSIAFVGIIAYGLRIADQMKAESAGEQFAEIGRALGVYINREAGNLSSCIPIGTSLPNIPLTVFTSATGTTTVGACTLNNRQVLSSVTPNKNLFGTGYNIGIQNNASGVLGGLVLSDDVIRDPGSPAATPIIKYDWLGIAMRKAGSQSGMTFSVTGANSLRGLGGGWALSNTDFAGINKLGLFGYRVGFQSNYDDVYLRLDGAYPMRGNLNMGNFNVNNATDINFNGWLNGNNALLNNLKTGYISNSGNIQTNTLTATKSISTGGRESNPLPTGWDVTDNIHTWNIYAENTIATGKAGSINASMDSSGLITAKNIRLQPLKCADTPVTTGLTAAEIASLRSTNCQTKDEYIGLLSDRLPQYVSQGVQIVTNGTVVQKPICPNSTPLINKARIVLTPQIQNLYGAYDVVVTYNTVTGAYGIQRSTTTRDQMQVYAVNGTTSWTVVLTSAFAPAGGQGFQALAETFCDFG